MNTSKTSGQPLKSQYRRHRDTNDSETLKNQRTRRTPKDSEDSDDSEDLNDTNDTEEAAPDTVVGTVSEAVSRSLQGEASFKSIFTFARAIKALEVSTGTNLRKELQSIFNQWWNASSVLRGPEMDYDECLAIFSTGYVKVKTPLGSNALEQAIRKAEHDPLPSQSKGHSARIAKLIAVCFHLQKAAGASPFYLSLRSVRRILNSSNLLLAPSLMNHLVSLGILVMIEKGTNKGRKATRYRFNFSNP